MPPTKIRFGISVPYFGAESGASRAVGAAPAGAAILCIGCGWSLKFVMGRILKAFIFNGGQQENYIE